MKDGIIVVNKPKGMTSNDVIYRMKRILGIKKIGHSGTLDPMAEGVLPILINKATRVAEYMDVDSKEYVCDMKLGVETITQDITGDEILSIYKEGQLTDEEKQMKACYDRLREEDILNAFSSIQGLTEQMPPMVSAVRIQGRRLYDYVYQGDVEGLKEIESKIKKRQVYIEKPKIIKIDLPFIRYRVTCSKGTYIRSICKDVGETLGTKAIMTDLIRTKSGRFNIEDSVDLNYLLEEAVKAGILDENFYSIDKSYKEDIPEIWLKYVKPLDFDMTFFGVCTVDKNMANKFIDGWHLSYKDVEILKKPSYKPPVEIEEIRAANPDSEGYNQGSYAGLKIKPEYARAYKIYLQDESNPKNIKSENFLGVAFHSDKYKKLVADKILFRGKV